MGMQQKTMEQMTEHQGYMRGCIEGEIHAGGPAWLHFDMMLYEEMP